MRQRRRLIAFFLAPAVLLAGCATTVPYTGQGPHPQLERGTPVPPIDFLGNALSLLHKLILWNWHFNEHYISPETEQKLVDYVDTQEKPMFKDAKFRLNQYRPLQDLDRLTENKHVAWPYRLLLGLPTTLITDVLLPGRLFPWGDYYNPFTNTVHLYSDDSAIAMHEAGHTHDFANRKRKGTYALLRFIPFVDLYQEYKATDEAIDYIISTGNREDEMESYRTLYPAYGTYIGNYFFIRGSQVIGALGGHFVAWDKVRKREKHYLQEEK